MHGGDGIGERGERCETGGRRNNGFLREQVYTKLLSLYSHTRERPHISRIASWCSASIPGIRHWLRISRQQIQQGLDETLLACFGCFHTVRWGRGGCVSIYSGVSGWFRAHQIVGYRQNSEDFRRANRCTHVPCAYGVLRLNWGRKRCRGRIVLSRTWARNKSTIGQ